MQREGSCLGGELAPARETQHIFKLCVPGHTVGIAVLRQQGLGAHAIHLYCVVVIHNCQLPSTAAQIQAPGRPLPSLSVLVLNAMLPYSSFCTTPDYCTGKLLSCPCIRYNMTQSQKLSCYIHGYQSPLDLQPCIVSALGVKSKSNDCLCKS